MTMILTSVTMVGWADVPDRDRVTSDVCVPSTYLVIINSTWSGLGRLHDLHLMLDEPHVPDNYLDQNLVGEIREWPNSVHC